MLAIREEETVVQARGHHDEIARLHEDPQPPLVASADLEDPLTVENKAHLILRVEVLVLELVADGLEALHLGGEGDLVLHQISPGRLERVEGHLRGRGPDLKALVVDPDGREVVEGRRRAVRGVEPGQLHGESGP